MKSVKFVLMAAAAFVGLASAYATTKRVVFTYVQRSAGNYYKKVNLYDPSKCSPAAALTCSFTVGLSLGSGPITKTLLTANGANAKTPSHRLYTGI